MMSGKIFVSGKKEERIFPLGAPIFFEDFYIINSVGGSRKIRFVFVLRNEYPNIFAATLRFSLRQAWHNVSVQVLPPLPLPQKKKGWRSFFNGIFIIKGQKKN
jgi:hypothetical protein